MRILLLTIPLTLGLAACSVDGEPDKGTTVSIDATSRDGDKVAIKADGDTGNVSLNVPGFDAKMRLPKKLLNDSNFDIDGVKLYPGSKVETFNITADETSGKGRADVRIAFSSPAEPAKVAGWFKEQFSKKSIDIGGDADTLTGKSEKGDAFTIELRSAGGSMTKGTVSISE
jgi:hypothetical protein